VQCLRGVSQVVLINNPVSGLIILVSLLLCPPAFLFGSVGLTCGTATAKLLGFDRCPPPHNPAILWPHHLSPLPAILCAGHHSELIRAGIYGYNGLLVGIAFTTFVLLPTGPVSMLVCLLLVSMLAGLSTVLTAALANAMVPLSPFLPSSLPSFLPSSLPHPHLSESMQVSLFPRGVVSRDKGELARQRRKSALTEQRAR
jgi:urea transporter